MMERPGADSEEKHEPASDIDIALMDSLKVLDPEGPIREADVIGSLRHVRFVPGTDFQARLENRPRGGPNANSGQFYTDRAWFRA